MGGGGGPGSQPLPPARALPKAAELKRIPIAKESKWKEFISQTKLGGINTIDQYYFVCHNLWLSLMMATAKIVTLITRTIIFHLLKYNEFLFQTRHLQKEDSFEPIIKAEFRENSNSWIVEYSHIQAGILGIQEKF